MADARRDTRERGLPSLNQARAERRSAMRRGMYALRGEVMPRFWLWAGVILSLMMIIYWKVSQGKLESQKSSVMAKQRAVAQVLSPQVVPHTEKIEAWVRELGGEWRGETFDPSAQLAQVQRRPAIYLRLRLDAAKDAKTLRREAAESLLDGFVSCMFVREGEGDPRAGTACETSADCEPGLLCNEYRACVKPPRPFNLRLGYAALRVLSTDWTDELHEATNELKVRAFERELERVAKNDVPIAVRMMEQAELFALVLDEPPPGELPAKVDPFETVEQRIQRVPHDARVAVWELRTGKELLRVRVRADGKFVPVGEHHAAQIPADQRSEEQARSVAAQDRQANSCALALATKAAVTKREAARGPSPKPAPDSPRPDASGAPRPEVSAAPPRPGAP